MITFLTEQLPRYGAHSGYYTQLVRAAQGSGASVEAIAAHSSLTQRTVGKLFSTWLGCPPRNQTAAAAELRFRLAWQFRRRGVFHVVNLDDHLPLLGSWSRPPQGLIGTLHRPPLLWEKANLQRLAHLALGIVLCRRDADFFAPYVRRVCFIPHGVDTEFFSPGPTEVVEPRVLFVGNWLRDFVITTEVIGRLSRAHPVLRFDLVIERACRRDSSLAALEANPAVRWHHDVDDITLLQLYRKATLLLLPLRETSANNAVVEALACGLPIVANQIGGITDYGGGEIFELVPERSADAFVALVEQYLAEPRRRSQVSRKCRAFAEERLAWSRIWRLHEGVYDSLRCL